MTIGADRIIITDDNGVVVVMIIDRSVPEGPL